MKHLRLFKTEAEYNSSTLELPNVSYVEETKIVGYKSNKPEVIEYHFDLRDAEWVHGDQIMHVCDKYFRGDLSELYDKIMSFLQTYGVKGEDHISFGEIYSTTPLENPKITVLVDDHETGEIVTYNLCYIEYYHGDECIYLCFDVPRGAHNSGGECFLTKDYFDLQIGTFHDN